MKILPVWNKQIAYHAIDLKSGDTVSRNENVFIYPASSFKIFIAAAVLESKNINDKIIVKPGQPKTDLFPINQKTMDYGVIKTIKELIILMLHQSDNRASNMLAEQIDIDAFLTEKGFNGSGKTEKFKQHSNWTMFSERIATSAQHLSEFIAKYQSELRPYILGNVGALLDNTIMHKSGSMETMSKSGPRFLRKFYNVKYRSDVAIIKNNDLYYAVAILTKYNAVKFGKDLNLKKIQKQIETRLNTR